MASGQKNTLRGYIAPADWDEDDNIRSLLLEADDDHDYAIEYFGPKIDFYDWVDHRVEVTGTVTKKSGKLVVETKQIVGLDDDDEPAEDEEYDDDEDEDEDEDEEFEQDEELIEDDDDR
jgi:hypothetical protein